MVSFNILKGALKWSRSTYRKELRRLIEPLLTASSLWHLHTEMLGMCICLSTHLVHMPKTSKPLPHVSDNPI